MKGAGKRRTPWLLLIVVGDWDKKVVVEEDVLPGMTGYRVGSGNKGDNTPLSLTVMEIGAAGIQRHTPVYVDINKWHPYYRDEIIIYVHDVPCDGCNY